VAIDKVNEEPTIGKLVVDAQRDISKLIASEVQLAKAELKVTMKAGGLGAVFFAAAGFTALMMLILLSFTVAFFIYWDGRGLGLHWAFLIVTGFYLLLTAVLGLFGVMSIKKAKAPERAIAQIKQNSSAFKRSGGSKG